MDAGEVWVLAGQYVALCDGGAVAGLHHLTREGAQLHAARDQSLQRIRIATASGVHHQGSGSGIVPSCDQALPWNDSGCLKRSRFDLDSVGRKRK
jgi:hypothetical protein